MIAMKRIFLLVFIFLTSFLYQTKVYADMCSVDVIHQYDSLINNVDVHYEYLGEFPNSDNGDFPTSKYHVIISGLINGLYVVVDDDSRVNSTYFGSDIPSGVVEFDMFVKDFDVDIYLDDCMGQIAKTISIHLPFRNMYASDERCSELSQYHLDICDEWYQGDLTYEEFLKITDPYFVVEMSNMEKVLSFVKKYMVFFIIGGVAIVVLIAFLIYRHYKRGVLE